MSLIDSYRRWESSVARLKMKSGRLTGMRPPQTEALFEEVVTTCDSLLQELASAEAENGKLRTRVTALQREWDYLFHELPTPCVVADTDAIIVSANRCAAELLNMSSRHLENRALMHFVQEDRDAFLKLLRELRPPLGQTRATFVIRPRERAPLRADVKVIPWKPEDTSLWLWFLEPSSPDIGRKTQKRAALQSTAVLRAQTG